MYRFVILLSLLLTPSLSSVSIEPSFSSREQAIKTLTKPPFFKKRVLFLETDDYTLSQDLDNLKKEIKWPLKIVYNKKHILKGFPLLPVPLVTTVENWNLNFEQLIGNISTPLIKMRVILKPIGDQIIYLNIESQITHKNIIVPFSNKVIEDDVCKQIQVVLYQVLKDSGFIPKDK